MNFFHQYMKSIDWFQTDLGFIVFHQIHFHRNTYKCNCYVMSYVTQTHSFCTQYNKSSLPQKPHREQTPQTSSCPHPCRWCQQSWWRATPGRWCSSARCWTEPTSGHRQLASPSSPGRWRILGSLGRPYYLVDHKDKAEYGLSIVSYAACGYRRNFNSSTVLDLFSRMWLSST